MAGEELMRQVLAEMQALRSEFSEVKNAVIGTATSPGHAEKIRALESEVLWLQSEVESLKIEVATLKAAPGRFALRWADTIALAIIIVLCTGLGGLVWAELHPSPPTIEDAAKAAGKGSKK